MKIGDYINIDGKLYPYERDMTAEEESAFIQEQEEAGNQSPSFEERLEAQVVYTAMMTDTLLLEA